ITLLEVVVIVELLVSVFLNREKAMISTDISTKLSDKIMRDFFFIIVILHNKIVFSLKKQKRLIVVSAF
ncbi:hypothetical protein, partial [Enterococcus hirae]|uniref:hypothetical protein n=1 Tax=Enterococcus hirae TaxID=1354 RepID=UPI0019D3F243